jgi:hypothetical protein
MILVGGAGLVAIATVLFVVLLLRIKQAQRTSKKAECYYCGSNAVRLSAPGGPIDWLLENWDCAPHRCEICFRRYYRFVNERRAR